jgi:hypothetical protein
LLLPLPKVVPQQPIKHNRKRGKTAIITSSPYMNELKNCQTPRHVKPPKQVKKYLFNDEAATKSNLKKKRKASSKSVKKKATASSSSSESYDSDDICQEKDYSNVICENNESFEEICLNYFVIASLKEVRTQVTKEFVNRNKRILLSNAR